MNNELTQWFAIQPFFTKWICLASLLIPIATKFQLLPIHHLVFHWPAILQRLQLWRPLTSIFIANLNIGFIFGLYFRFQYSSQLEGGGVFGGKPADYAWFLCIVMMLLTAGNAYMGMAVMWEAFSMAIVHVWSQYNRDVTVRFMFGFKFPAMYLSVVMAGYSLVMGGDVLGTLMGIFVGHIYYFGREVYGKQNPSFARLFQPPALLTRLIGRLGALKPGQSVTSSGFTMQAPRRPFAGKEKVEEENASSFRPFSGSSHKLGTD